MARKGRETGAQLLERHQREGLISTVLPDLDEWDAETLAWNDRRLKSAVRAGWEALAGVDLEQLMNGGGPCSIEQGRGGGGFTEDPLQSRSGPTPPNCTPGNHLAVVPPPPGPPPSKTTGRKR